MEQIKTIIFDFGDVLVKDTTKVLEKKYGFDRLPRAAQNAYIKAFHQSEMGNLPTRELLNAIRRTLVPQKQPREIEQFIVNTRTLPVWQLAVKLSKNYRVIIFSNNQKRWPRMIADKLGIDFFRFPFVNSSYVGMRKPDKAFYRYLAAKFSLKPQETVFVDDKFKNLVPAKRMGIHTFPYQNNPADLKKFLKKLGIRDL